MQSYQARTRLFIPVDPLVAGAHLMLDGDQAHYLRSVLRAGPGDVIELFNNKDGAFNAEILTIDKARVALSVRDQSAVQEVLPKLALAFAIVKKERLQLVVEKATELGAAKICPIISARTQGQAVKQLKEDKLQRYIIEAAEQCGRTALASLAPPQSFDALLAQTAAPDRLLYADEMAAGQAIDWPQPTGWTTLLTGPEGGFSPEERTALQAHEAAHAISLGPRILRAETAAIAALSLWQHRFGDWR